MNALDFINKEIEGCIKNIEFCEYKGWDAPEYTQRLIDLKEVKKQLEAWEKIKGRLTLNDETHNIRMNTYFRTTNYQKIKKALDVEDEKEKK